MEDRKKEEIDFHNQREIDRKRLSDDEYEKKYSNKRFYKIQRKSTKYFHYIQVPQHRLLYHLALILLQFLGMPY